MTWMTVLTMIFEFPDTLPGPGRVFVYKSLTITEGIIVFCHFTFGENVVKYIELFSKQNRILIRKR